MVESTGTPITIDSDSTQPGSPADSDSTQPGSPADSDSTQPGSDVWPAYLQDSQFDSFEEGFDSAAEQLPNIAAVRSDVEESLCLVTGMVDPVEFDYEAYHEAKRLCRGGAGYDHVLTLYVNVLNPDGNTGPPPYSFNFDRLGVRVPTIMVSPWIKKGTVISKANGPTPDYEYEHSSVPATIKEVFNLSSDYLTHIDAWANTFEHIVGELTSPRTDCPEDVDVVSRTKSGSGGPLNEIYISSLESQLDEMYKWIKYLDGENRILSSKDSENEMLHKRSNDLEQKIIPSLQTAMKDAAMEKDAALVSLFLNMKKHLKVAEEERCRVWLEKRLTEVHAQTLIQSDKFCTERGAGHVRHI